MFTAEELAAEAVREEERKKEYEEKLNNAFFKDGGERNLVINRIDKEDKVSQKGNNYVLHTYYLTDSDTAQEEMLIDRNFAFTNAMGPIKKELGVTLRLGTTVLKCVTTKSGEREWNGVKYPEFSHTLAVVSNPEPNLVKVGDAF